MTNQNKPNLFFSKLESSLKENYQVNDESFIKTIKDKYLYQVSYLELSIENILNTLESKQISKENNVFKSIKDLELSLIESFNEEISKKTSEQTKKGTTKNKQENQVKSYSKHESLQLESSLINNNSTSLSVEKSIKTQNFSNKTYSFRKILNLYLGSPQNEVPTKLNTSNISLNLYSDLEIKEYSIGAKNNNEYLEGIRRYFNKVSENIKNEYKDIVFDSSSGNFIFMVSFKNTDFAYESLIFIDPNLNWHKYKVCFEECENVKSDSIFHEGQIIITHGKAQGNVFFPLSITLGMPLVQYNIIESSLVHIYKQHLPYMINILYGPFLKSDSIDITLFSRTLMNIANSDPHCLILGGPFISVENTLFQKGEISFLSNNLTNSSQVDEETRVSLCFFEYFSLILDKIEEVFLNKRTNIVIIPSVKDILNIYPIPQPKYDSKLVNIEKYELFKRKRLNFIGNPQIIKINEVIFGVTNYEMIDEILSNSVKSTKTSNIDQVLDSVLKQSSFLPVLPMKKENFQSNLLLEYREFEKLVIETIPDVYITPFKNIPLAKKSNSSIFINPLSAVYKSRNSEVLGSYINMYVYPNSKILGTSVVNRIRVDRVVIEEDS